MFNIKKRDGRLVEFDRNKIEKAILKAYKSLDREPDENVINEMACSVENLLLNKFPSNHIATVEEIQDLVEITLIENRQYEVVKSYILYRAQHTMNRKIIEKFSEYITDNNVIDIIRDIQNDFDRTHYDIEQLFLKWNSFLKKDMTQRQYLLAIIKAAAELTSKESPNWEYISARFMVYDNNSSIKQNSEKRGIKNFYDKIKTLTDEGLYGDYILKEYTEEDINELEVYMDSSRDKLFNYSGLDLIVKRYLIRDSEGNVLENIQEMFMGISMHLAIPEGNNKVSFAKKLYDILSTLKITVATPTMSNARKPYHQLSSCFIDIVPDSLTGIYRTIDNFAQVSKHGGGMGIYFGKVRSQGSDIRGFKGVAGGVVRWIRLTNDTAVAVDQLGVRQGSVAVYLDVWHKDMPEFLQLRTNNGDDRQKAHDVFPAVSYPDLFWRLAKNNIEATWYLFDPHEIEQIMGYKLEDYYGDEWEKRYYECVNNNKLSRRTISVKDMIRLIIVSLTETGTPFTFNRDAANKANPNKHVGMIYSSNLCTEIMQNMKAIETMDTRIEEINKDSYITKVTKAGDFVVCNLASLVLGNINLEDEKELENIVSITVRALDNVIDLNYYPVPYAEITNQKYRAIGLGTSGYHHALVQRGIMFSSEEHLEFMDKIYENINYFAIKASSEIAKEKGAYKYFNGSEWESGEYFRRRDYSSNRWKDLQESVRVNGLRNAYLMAIAPTGSTSIIAGTSAGVDPVMKRYFLEEKKGSIIPRVAPGLNAKTFWNYENAHEVDQDWIIRAASIRQRHIDQGQSVNLYITTDYTMRKILNLLISANEMGIKSIYYVRGKSLEVEECDTCSA
ncbi:ribonucleoside-diphosphate reductase subunit alpha [Peptoniphilus sp. oral taxon 386]|uniref:ribonucleoside-diphosphate reductase subunit alpha n=1 Tax=Peptoniphilus sp. oral taxon 386 TaxID=652713 RepID=UPI0001DA9B4E|nr:ribonucleoside-diphosphate reductase subunit alpha [Peptoniphilus sp. oral taxon 386]EFI42327.1 ribonucleoside-diphosphate reductase, alpha subunit [Peptoniphilus sp. oral taxon 386 str. F0131]